MHNSLSTDKRFKNKYIKKKKCYLCNKELDENIEHLFYNCHMTRTLFKYIKDRYLKDKTLVLSLELLKFTLIFSVFNFNIKVDACNIL